MKNIFTLLIALFAIVMVNGQNLLDSALAGYENPAVSGNFLKKAFCEDLWYGKTDTAFYRTTDIAAAGVASLAFDVDTFENLTEDKKISYSIFPSVSTLPSASYIVSYKLFLDAANSLVQIQTKTDTPNKIVKWDISSTPKGEWVTMKKLIIYEDQILGKYYLQVPSDYANAAVVGAQKFYIDDQRFESYVMETIDGNYLDHYYYGFEAGTEIDVDGVFIPATSDPYVSFSYEKNDSPASNFYALKFDVPAGSTEDYSIQLGDKANLGGAGSAVVPTGDYLMTLNIFMDDRNISEIETAFNSNDATTEQDEWLSIKWDIPEDIALGEWVTLKQKVTLAMDYDTKMTIKATQEKLVDNSQNAVFYIDDIAFVDAPSAADRTNNELDVDYYGIEKGSSAIGNGVFLQTSTYSISTNKLSTNDNLFCYKFYSADVSSLGNNQSLQIGSGADDPTASKITVSAGIYDVYIKLWAGEGAPSQVSTNFAAGEDFSFQSLTWDMPIGANTAQWIELTQQVTFTTAAPSVKLTIKTVKNNFTESGSSLFYIDDIALVKATSTGIKKHNDDDVRIYPNPAQDIVNIEATAGSRISIYSISGNLIKSISNASALTTLSTVDMAKGVYLISIKNNDDTIVKKLQVK